MLGQRLLFICAKISRNHNTSHLQNLKKTYPLAIHWRSVSSYGEDPKDSNRIYYGSLTPRMKAVKIFSITTSLTGLAAQPILMEQGSKLGGTALAIFLCGFVGFFTFITPVLLHIITKKYVTEIHYDSTKDEYTVRTLSFFLRKIETKFKASDVKVPEVPGMFTSFVVKGTPFLVDPSQFTDTEHYIKIMGYDKPIDFKLNLEDQSSGKEGSNLKK